MYNGLANVKEMEEAQTRLEDTLIRMAYRAQMMTMNHEIDVPDPEDLVQEIKYQARQFQCDVAPDDDEYLDCLDAFTQKVLIERFLPYWMRPRTHTLEEFTVFCKTHQEDWQGLTFGVDGLVHDESQRNWTYRGMFRNAHGCTGGISYTLQDGQLSWKGDIAEANADAAECYRSMFVRNRVE